MDFMNDEIYCTISNKKILVKDCLDCDKFYDCDNTYCDNHNCNDCENKKMGICKGD